MSQRDPDIDRFVKVLRNVRSSDAQRRRVASRLRAAGLLTTASDAALSNGGGAAARATGSDTAGTTGSSSAGAAGGSSTATGGPAVATSATKVSLLAKAAALPLVAKAAPAAVLLAASATAAFLWQAGGDTVAGSDPKAAGGQTEATPPSRDGAGEPDSGTTSSPPSPHGVQPPDRRTSQPPRSRSAAPRKGVGAGGHASPPSVAPQPMSAPRSPLAEEALLLGQALRALHLGQRDLARTLLQQHERRFPDGALANERNTAFLILDATQDNTQALEGRRDLHDNPK